MLDKAGNPRQCEVNTGGDPEFTKARSEALTKAACRLLELDPNELQAEYRPALTDAGRRGQEAEIYLYDTLSGGAGFARRVGELGLAVFEEALRILEACPERCDRSCYRCWRSYKNKFEHNLLDRHLGASLLSFLISGSFPTLDSRRLAFATTMLFEDLCRQGLEDVTIEKNHPVTHSSFGSVSIPIRVRRADEFELFVGLSEPLTRNTPADSGLKSVMESSPSTPVRLLDEILIARNLPAATQEVIDAIETA